MRPKTMRVIFPIPDSPEKFFSDEESFVFLIARALEYLTASSSVIGISVGPYHGLFHFE